MKASSASEGIVCVMPEGADGRLRPRRWRSSASPSGTATRIPARSASAERPRCSSVQPDQSAAARPTVVCEARPPRSSRAPSPAPYQPTQACGTRRAPPGLVLLPFLEPKVQVAHRLLVEDSGEEAQGRSDLGMLRRVSPRISAAAWYGGKKLCRPRGPRGRGRGAGRRSCRRRSRRPGERRPPGT